MKQYVIIGNGTAAVGCIEGIRSVDRENPILVVSSEPHPVYCRPLISYYLEGKTDLKRINYRPEDFYKENNVTVLYGKNVTAIQKDAKTVAIDDGTEVAYDALCVATGSTPFVPPMKGLELVKHPYSFYTLDDTLALEQAITPASRVLIVGAGLIGLKCAEGLHKRVASITVCDLAPRILSSILDDEGAAIVQAHLEENGLSFCLADSVAEFEANTAHMTSGKTVPFDVLVLAVGVRANTTLLRDAGAACGRGITIDTKAQTTLADIYAAGDCTETVDFSSGTVKVMALLPNAYMQGKCAGENMAGKEAEFTNAIPMNSIGFFGLHTMTAGTRFAAEDGGEVFETGDTKSIKKLFQKDGYLTGFELVGTVERAGIYTSLIRNRIPLDSVDFETLKQIPELRTFSKEYRKKTLGGVSDAD